VDNRHQDRRIHTPVVKDVLHAVRHAIPHIAQHPHWQVSDKSTGVAAVAASLRMAQEVTNPQSAKDGLASQGQEQKPVQVVAGYFLTLRSVAGTCLMMAEFVVLTRSALEPKM
jgi:hypothetical protein